MRRLGRWLPYCLVAVGLGLGCRAERRGDADTGAQSARTAPDSGAGMAGMNMGGSASNRLMTEMDAHLRETEALRPDSLKALLPQHRQRVANLIAELNREMRDMNMTADAAWAVTVDSLRQDLTRMPELAAADLRELMPGHRHRVHSLMAMHRSMMAAMRR